MFEIVLSGQTNGVEADGNFKIGLVKMKEHLGRPQGILKASVPLGGLEALPAKYLNGVPLHVHRTSLRDSRSQGIALGTPCGIDGYPPSSTMTESAMDGAA